MNIPRPPWTGLGSRLESLCRKALYDYDMVKNVDKVAVALSGGKDSLSLLFLLAAISGRGFGAFELHAVHVAGEFSCGAGVQEDYLRGVCRDLGVQFHKRESTQKLESLECYSCSRERRRLIFEAAKAVGAPVVAFGHHRDDSVQTLLMNLLHKGEFAANLAKVPMHDYGVTIIRPLIYVPEEDVRSFARMYGFERISCRCPVGQTSMRRSAARLIEEMEAVFPNARENLAQAGLRFGSQKALAK